MIDFLRRLFGHSGSSSAAKERLRLVLMTDHLELSPDMVDSMKRDLVDVISRYVEVDREKIDVSFERQDQALAMLANIPILAVNRATNGHAAEPVAAVVDSANEADSPVPETPVETPAVEPVADAEPQVAQSAPEDASADEAQDAPPAADGNVDQPPDIKRRRRRRKRKAATVGATEAVPAD